VLRLRRLRIGWRLRGDEMAPELGDDEPTRDRLVHEKCT
jgi:hypothetical protein